MVLFFRSMDTVDGRDPPRCARLEVSSVLLVELHCDATKLFMCLLLLQQTVAVRGGLGGPLDPWMCRGMRMNLDYANNCTAWVDYDLVVILANCIKYPEAGSSKAFKEGLPLQVHRKGLSSLQVVRMMVSLLQASTHMTMRRIQSSGQGVLGGDLAALRPRDFGSFRSGDLVDDEGT